MRKVFIAIAAIAAIVAVPAATIQQANAGVTATVSEKPNMPKTVSKKRKKGDKIVIPTNPVDLHCDIYPRNCGD